MNKKTVFGIIGVLLVGLVLLVMVQRQAQPPTSSKAIKDSAPSTPQVPTAAQSSPAALHVPAHYETAPALNSLAATLTPERFTGKARQSYQVVREAPQLIAQMPCYCHCDRGLGHKSLHSCFEDDHAANCATCIEEALMAYALHKQGLSAEKIRERIIAEFSDAE